MILERVRKWLDKHLEKICLVGMIALELAWVFLIACVSLWLIRAHVAGV